MDHFVILLPDDWGDEFASTYKEWHYFVGGAAITAVLVLLGVFYLAAKWLNR